MVERLTARKVTALLGPRRFGKTSLLRKVAAVVEDAGTSVVWVDLYETSSIADLARRFDHALANARGPVHRLFSDVSVRFGLNLGFLGAELSKRRDERPDPDATFDSLLDTLVSSATEVPTIVIIDEFPGLERVVGAEGRLRTKLQHHVQDIGLIFAGSQPSLMRSMFSDRTRPFFAQADLVEVGPLDLAATIDIVTDGFRATERSPGDLPGLIHQLTDGHPYRTMQVADCAWRTVSPDRPPGRGTWADTLDLLRAETNLACDAVFTGFTAGEKSALRLLAHGEPLFGSAAETLGLSAGSAQHAVETLAADGDIWDRDGHRSIVDPVLADWIRNRFPR